METIEALMIGLFIGVMFGIQAGKKAGAAEQERKSVEGKD